MIRGWAYYYRSFCSRKTFEAVDRYIYMSCKRYGLRRHPNKEKKWVINKYFSVKNPNFPKDKWLVGDNQNNIFMYKLRYVPIKRHSMIPNGDSPDDPLLEQWWLQRKLNGVNSNLITPRDNKIARNQRHTCPWCLQSLYNHEPIEKHHIISKKNGASDKYNNLF